MANTPSIQGDTLGVTAVGSLATTPTEKVTSFSTTALVNFPTAFVQGTTLGVTAAVRRTSVIQVTSYSITAVVRGRIQSPYALAWTFTLDGHDYYVINLYDETLVYDLAEQRWYVWADNTGDIWHLRYGLNWVQTTALAYDEGTNIVCGDDTTGALFFLDPDKAEDDSALGDGTATPFERVAYGQMPVRGNAVQPCFGVQLTGSLGDVQDPTLTAVTLYTSDDQGHTFVNCGTLDVEAGSYGQRMYWSSLGSMSQPGRLFKIVDYGGLHRLDGLDMDDDDPSTPQ